MKPRRTFLCFLCVLLLNVPAFAETLTIATYNIENYGPANRMTEAGYRKDYPKPESEKAALRSVTSRAVRQRSISCSFLRGRPRTS